MENNNKKSRRDFIRSGTRLSILLTLGAVGGIAAKHLTAEKYVWQIDPFKCTQCGRCATSCVMTPSAVKCIHAFNLCGYCDLCGGYLKPDANKRSTAAEDQLCPTAAIARKFIEEPYFEYVINEDLCIGCAKCVKGCTSFGNGSLHLQIIHKRCLNCNECSIARLCPSQAISRVKASKAYNVKGSFTKDSKV
ncbi:MAG: ferredoxin [Bacteroidia bacterium]|nr:ferredoxin [Bacteroidia bacterium]